MSLSIEPFDPRSFGPPLPSSAPSAGGQCPKCSWHHPAGAPACAACGLIFAKFAEAEGRRRQRAMTHTPRVAATDRFANDRFAHDRFAHDRFAPSSSSAASSAAGLTLDGVAAGPGAMVAEALSSSSSSVVTLALLQVVLWVVAVAAGVAAGVAAATMGPGPAMVVAGGVGALMMLWVCAATMAGSMVVVDDAMRGGDHRGFGAALGAGWARRSSTLGVMLAVLLLMVLPGAIAMAVTVGDPSAALMGAIAGKVPVLALAVTAFALANGVFMAVRLSLAVPAVVLGDRSMVEALQESFTLTRDHSALVAKTLALALVVSVALSALVGALSLIPLLGLLIGFVGNVFVGGFSLAVASTLWRRLSGA
jgi:hypothetical protein